jgi:hypothetical protein
MSLLRKLGRQRRDRRAQLLLLSGGHAGHASSALHIVRPLPLQQRGVQQRDFRKRRSRVAVHDVLADALRACGTAGT